MIIKIKRIKNYLTSTLLFFFLSFNLNAQEVVSATDPQKIPLLSDKLKKTISNVVANKKLESLMLDASEAGDVDRAIEALKNNQTYTPESKNDLSATSDEDLKAKEEELKREASKKQENEKSYIYLASIMYFGEKSWVVWINDKKISNESNKEGSELYIKSTSRDSVEVLWTLSLSKWKILSGKKSEDQAPKINENNQVEISFELKPNQTYILSLESVVEGKVVSGE